MDQENKRQAGRSEQAGTEGADTSSGFALLNHLPLEGKAVTEETVRKWNITLAKYKAGKAHLDQRVLDAERWWKLRNEITEEVRSDPKNDGFRSKSSWLHNVIVNKHADAVEAYHSRTSSRGRKATGSLPGP